MAPKSKVQEDLSISKKEFQAKLRTPQERLCYLFDSHPFFDIIFKFLPDDKEPCTIKGQLLYLSLCSSVFESMFLAKDTPVMEHLVTDVSPSIFTKMLIYLYKNELNCQEDTEAFLLYDAAEKYRLFSLKLQINEYLMKIRMNMDNVISLLNSATEFCITSLTKKCIEFIEEHPEVCMESEIYFKMTESSVNAVLRMQRMKLQSEDTMLKLLVTWINSKNLGEDGPKVFTSLLSFIRFDGMTARDFLYIIKNNPTHFTKPQILDILRYMARPRYGLPTWCEQPSPVKGKKEVSIQKGPMLNIPSEFRLISHSNELINVIAKEVSTRICVRCTRLTEFILGVKIQVMNIEHAEDGKVVMETSVIEPDKTTTIQNNRYEQQSRFEDNCFNFLFKQPIRLYYNCKIIIKAKMSFPRVATLLLSTRYLPSSYLVDEEQENESEDKDKEKDNNEGKEKDEEKKDEEKDKEYAFFSALFYIPRETNVRLDNVE